MNRFRSGVRHLANLMLVLAAIVTSSCSANQISGSSGSNYNVNSSTPTASGPYPPFGFTTFPFAATVEAVERTHEIARENGTIYAIHRDNGIPWAEALKNEPYPKKVRDTWDEYVKHRPSNVPVYVALSPLGEDRETLIYASEGSKNPDIFKRRNLDDRDVIQAYKNYVFKAIEVLDPDFLNIGIEAGELAFRKPREWAKFETLYFEVARAVKAKHPNLSIGISFGLQTFLEDGVVERSQPLINESDFIGISFYPYMSQFHERFGAAALPAPPHEWRAPLETLRSIATKPIAICETGYSSKPVEVPRHNLSLNGTPQLQLQYVQELGAIASRDNYAFVVWFMPVDYDRLFETIPQGDGTYRLWQNIGLYDKDLRAKPALDAWKTIISGEPAAQIAVTPQRPAPTGSSDNTSKPAETIGFSGGVNGFAGSADDKLRSIAIQPSNALPSSVTHALEWSYSYKNNRWQYMVRELESGALAQCSSVIVHLKSNQSGPILMQLEEAGGEAFFSVIMPSDNWKEHVIPFSALELSKETRQNGQLSAAALEKILFADTGAVTEGARGSRVVQIGQIQFR